MPRKQEGPQPPVGAQPSAAPESIRPAIVADQRDGWPFADWSVDADQIDGDDESAGEVNRQPVELPSERHVALYRLLRSTSHYDQAGRLVSWWPQKVLAARLNVSIRTVRNLLADLREPGLDPRHPRGQPPGLRLGVVRVEPTSYRDSSTGKHRLGGNLYVLIEHGQQASRAEPLSAGQLNRQADSVACLNKEPPASEERWVSTPTVSSSLAPVPLPVDLRYRGRPLNGSDADFHAAVDQLERDTCGPNGDRCQSGHPCRRHTRRRRPA